MLPAHLPGMNTTQARQPRGIPVGGQFAATAHAEADLSLAPDNGGVEPPEHEYTSSWGETSYEFPRWAEEKAIASIERANRRAEKAGIPDRFTYEIEHYERRVPDPNGGVDRFEERTRLTLDRPTVEHNGWRFAATLTWDPEAGMVSRTVPGETLLERPEEKRCDVCGKPRNRRDTYVIQRDGEQMQVGSDCLEQFLGIRPQGLWMLDFEPDCPAPRDEENYGATTTARDVRYDTRDVLRIGLAVVRQHGWVPRSAAYEGRPATADLVAEVVENRPRTDTERRWIDAIRTEAQDLGEEAAEVLALARDMDGDSDYAFNMRAAAAPDTVTWRNAPLLLSAISTKYKNEERQARRKATANSQHIGKPKDKIADHEVEVIGVRHTDGFRGGVTTIVTMTDTDGNVLKWFASGHKDYETGKRYKVKATIKGHDEYQGVKETAVTRATLDPLD